MIIPKKYYIVFYIVVVILIIATIYFLKKDINNRRYQKTGIYKKISYGDINLWNSDKDLEKAKQPFEESCNIYKKWDKNKVITKAPYVTKASDWVKVCNSFFNNAKNQNFKDFLEKNFNFYVLNDYNKATFTGYYRPIFKGSLKRTIAYKYPLYKKPNDLTLVDLGAFDKDLEGKEIRGRVQGKTFVPYYTREEISSGALKNKHLELVWLKNPLDAFYIQVQGSGIIELLNKKKVYLSFASKNGHKFSGFVEYAIKNNYLPSYNGVKGVYDYFEKHPENLQKVLNSNKSFVFFKEATKDNFVGSFGSNLFEERTIAVDNNYVGKGTLVFIETFKPNTKEKMGRLVIANDIGSAIKGEARADIYWGEGDKAAAIASITKDSRGSMYILVPKAN